MTQVKREASAAYSVALTSAKTGIDQMQPLSVCTSRGHQALKAAKRSLFKPFKQLVDMQ